MHACRNIFTNRLLSRFCLNVSDECSHVTATTATIVGVCLKCGITKKSGKMSCCGRGGSWFGKCGSAGNTKLGHTWHEGLESCKARSPPKIVISQQLNGADQDGSRSSNDVGSASSKTQVVSPKQFALTSASTTAALPIVASVGTNTSTSHAALTIRNHASNTLQTTLAQKPVISQGYTSKYMLGFTVHMIFLFISCLSG